MTLPRIAIVSPAVESSNNGNWHTAARWAGFLKSAAQVQVLQHWNGEPAELLIALHARKSADAIARFAAVKERAAVIVVLTGTDLYRDLPGDTAAARSLDLADRIVVLQTKALERLPDPWKEKAAVIEQSATRWIDLDKPKDTTAFIAIGHLRDEKDPRTLLQAVRHIDRSLAIQVDHLGSALDDHLADEASSTMQLCSSYRWHGGVPQSEARSRLARAHALVHPSRMEGGANVLIEAIRSQVAVLASRIDGNVGLLGEDYGGYFPVGDAEALARLMERFALDAGFAASLQQHCVSIEHRFTPRRESESLHDLVNAMLRSPRHESRRFD